MASAGRVEVCSGGVWGTVCDDSWGREEALVVCRQLGYVDSQNDSIPLASAYFGHGLTTIHLDDIECVGNEGRLIDCPHSGVGQHNCHHAEDAGVICPGV